MTKIDNRVHYLFGLDTETCNAHTMPDGKSDLKDSLVYDIGWVVTDKKGTVYKSRSFVIYEIFVGMKDVMTSAYYASKIPNYWTDIKAGKRQLVTLQTAINAFYDDMYEYGIDTVFAHHAQFDFNALNNTVRYITKSAKRFFFPRNMTIWDTQKMANDTIAKQKTYKKFCADNGYMTAHKTPRPQVKAEVLYRYISGDNTFDESHTGLEDVMIEKEILAKCFRQHKKMRKCLFKNEENTTPLF